MATATKNLLTGRSLKSLTPEEIEDLLKTADVNINSLQEVDGKSSDSLHPKYEVKFAEGDDTKNEHLAFTTWESGLEDWNDHEGEIFVGEVWDHVYGPSNSIAVIRWFLEHGWTWEIPLKNLAP